jgi:A nuclease family of the HNH/ENDO VII superfamily with conserved AHH
LEAHHVIPWELRYHPLVQAAARAGFDMNSAENGILLTKLVTEPWPSGYNVTKATLTVEQELDVTQAIQIVEGVHANHPAHNFYVLKRLQDLLAEVTTPEGIIDPDAARAVLENQLIPELVPQLGGAAALNIVVNDHFKKVITDNGWRDLYGFYNRDPKMYRFIHGDYTDPY